MPVATSTLKPSASNNKIIIPDLVSHCTFPLRFNPHCKKVGVASEAWLMNGGNLSVKKQKAFRGLKGGLLTAMCYPDCGQTELRVCCDYLIYLFHLDNISDCMDGQGTNRTADVVMNSLYHAQKYQTNSRVGKMTKECVIFCHIPIPHPNRYFLSSYWRRLTPTAAAGMKQRFMSTFDMFFQAVTVQAADRLSGTIPDLESYITLRRDTSGCKPCWALIEYANGLDIPDNVMEHQLIRDCGEAANDLVTWSNVRNFSAFTHLFRIPN